MVQIARTTLQGNKAFHIALRSIFGIGPTNALQITEACGISTELKVGPPCRGVQAILLVGPKDAGINTRFLHFHVKQVQDVKEPYIKKVAAYIQDNYVVGDQLKRQIRNNILQLIDMKSYRGNRWAETDGVAEEGLQQGWTGMGMSVRTEPTVLLFAALRTGSDPQQPVREAFALPWHG